MAKLSGFDRVIEQLREKLKARMVATEASIVVGYTAKYALWVHENMEPTTLGQNVPRPSGLGDYWGPSQYGPQYLRGPAREYASDIAGIIRRAFQQGKSAEQALLLGGLKLQAESMRRVPVEYGFLRASAFTAVDKETK